MNVDLELDGGRGKRLDAERVGDWMQTWTGKRFYPADPRAADVDFVDVAHALAHTSRYGGHCQFYSVAEHSVLVSHMVPQEHALAALLHDAPEAYIADVIRPVKRILTRSNAYFELEARIWAVIAERFGIAAALPECVKVADTSICIIERRALHPRAQEWDFPMAAPEGVQIRCYNPANAMLRFMARFCDLTGMDTAQRLELTIRANDLWQEDELHFRDTCGGLRDLVA